MHDLLTSKLPTQIFTVNFHFFFKIRVVRPLKLTTDCYSQFELFTFIHEQVLAPWIQWKKVQEISREVKPEKIYDLSGLIISSKTTISTG